MNKKLAKILNDQIVYDDSGNSYKLHSHTRKEQGLAIQDLIRKIKPRKTLEVGLAYGISTLFICEALKESGGVKHIVMDPYQKDWHNIGLKHIKEFGYEKWVDFKEDLSDRVLSDLYLKKESVDFAYMDSSKVFDVELFNVYLLTRILRIGGVIVFDDCSFPGIKKLVRFLRKHPSFRLVFQFKKIKTGYRRRIFSRLCGFLPYSHKIFRPEILEPDYQLGLDYHCIGFEKISEDNRNWKWHADF